MLKHNKKRRGGYAKTRWKFIFIEPPNYGEHPEDYCAIQQGIDLYNSYFRITKSFEKNKELFEKSIAELSTKEDFYKYEQTINLMKKLKIKNVSKVNGNVNFLFSSSLYPGGKAIAYITDLEDYINMGNKIREKQQISGN